jgi:hypothetical protein
MFVPHILRVAGGWNRSQFLHITKIAMLLHGSNEAFPTSTEKVALIYLQELSTSNNFISED